MDEGFFISNVLNSAKSWDNAEYSKLGTLFVPDKIMGARRKSLLRGDINIQWGSWFIESIVDPYQYIPFSKDYSNILEDSFLNIKNIFTHLTHTEQHQLACIAAEEVFKKVQFLRQTNKRSIFSREERFYLLEDSGVTPRCWICGHNFSQEAIDSFIDQKKYNIPKPIFIDIFKPSGINDRDLKIEIDHVYAHSHGGEDDLSNLKICCGWCNQYKSAFRSIYDVSGAVIRAKNNKLNISSLPQKFWIVRLLALVGKCEHESGCEKSIENSELTIEPIIKSGAPTPSNIRVICPKHHYLGPKRMLPVEEVKQAWEGKN